MISFSVSGIFLFDLCVYGMVEIVYGMVMMRNSFMERGFVFVVMMIVIVVIRKSRWILLSLIIVWVNCCYVDCLDIILFLDFWMWVFEFVFKVVVNRVMISMDVWNWSLIVLIVSELLINNCLGLGRIRVVRK